MPTRLTYLVGDEGGYPEIPINTLGGMCKDDTTTPERILDALVDVINRSPWKPQDWATKLGIDFTQFVRVCHREIPMPDEFRKKVCGLFRKFATKQKPTWDEVAKLLNT